MSEAASVNYKASLTRLALFALFLLVACPAVQGEVALTSTQVPFGYDVLPNVTYVRRPAWDGKLDLFVPSDRTSSTPVLVWFHGGGWTRSSKEEELLYFLPYLERRWAVINVEYRLAGVAKAPAAVSDGLCAMRWLAKHAQDYKLQLDRLVVSGISAGGGMALIVGTTPASSPLARDCGTDAEFGGLPVPRVIVNWFGPSDLLDVIDGPHRHAQIATWFDGVPNRLEVARTLSAVKCIHSPTPAVITIHGEHDQDIPYAQSVALHRVLDRVGAPNELVKIDAGHGDFTPAQASYAYGRVFRFIEERFKK